MQCRPGALSALSIGFEFVQEFPNRVRGYAHYNSVDEHISGQDTKGDGEKIVNSRVRPEPLAWTSVMVAGFLVFRNGSPFWIWPLTSRRSRSAKKRRHQLQRGEIKVQIVIATKARAGHQITGSSNWVVLVAGSPRVELSHNLCL